MSGAGGGSGRVLAVGLVLAALTGIGAITGGLVLLLDPGAPEVIGPSGEAGAAGPAESRAAPYQMPGQMPGQASDRMSDAAVPPPLVMPMSVPERVRIPTIKVNAPVESLGLDKNGWLEVPSLKRPNLTGWYRLGPSPGQLGPAVIVGHVNNKAGPAVFARLGTLRKGDTVEVKRKDGSVAVFTVNEVERVHKRTFPTARVYGNLSHAGLRLITCGGAFDPKTGSYADNIIVYASLSATR
ncbi:class F sortase [Thermopolyspora sp. NPDC052614]|uniref:class F sortase n=1 Tax=Thermopolyspora sp. NPDC052614 TaxID=3155682 RepID=UPI00343B69A2